MSSTTEAVTRQNISIMDTLVKESPTLGEFMGMRIASGEGIGLPTGTIVLWPTLTSKHLSSKPLGELYRSIGIIKQA